MNFLLNFIQKNIFKFYKKKKLFLNWIQNIEFLKTSFKYLNF